MKNINNPMEKTGYSIYKEEAKERKKENTLEELYPKLPNKKFDIIYADPPWDYGGKLQFDKSSKGVDKIDISKKIFISSASFKYPTLKTKEIMKLQLNEIAKDDCILFMWTSNPHLSQAIELGESWGFKYRTIAFVWDKMNHNPGQYTLSNCELCLLFKKGKIPQPRGARNVQQLVKVKRGKHSEKPIEVLQGITKMFPTQDKIEVNGKILSSSNMQENFVYYLVNKPLDYVCTTRSFKNEKNILELVPKNPPVWPVGRLDKNSRGLIILTNDGDLTNKFTHPKFEHEKEYEVEVDKNINQNFFMSMKKGIKLEEGITRADKIRKINTRLTAKQDKTFSIVLHQGRKRQIRRMCTELNYRVTDL